MIVLKWEKNYLVVTPNYKPKKITGTRFSSVLGLDKWTTPFKTWCAITKVYEEPFVDNKYTIAGKIIEPKVVDYLKRTYFLDIKTPEDTYGKDFFKKTYGDFFPNEPIFGGMWDGLILEDGKITGILEIKTTSRAEDWKDGSPEHYGLQASLYAYLLGLDTVYMVCSLLEEKDYINPESFVPSIENTIIDIFKVSERYPQMFKHIERAIKWWNEHVITGISPAYDEKRDAEILKALRTKTASDGIESLIEEAEKLKKKIDRVTESIKEDEKQLKAITERIKEHCVQSFDENTQKVELTGNEFKWSVSKTISTEIDKKALEKDGLLDKYTIKKESYRITVGSIN